MDQIQVRGGSKDLRIFQAFTTPAEVIRRSRGLRSFLKSVGGREVPEITKGELIFPRPRPRGLLVVLAKNLARERVHKVDLPTHDTGHGFTYPRPS